VIKIRGLPYEATAREICSFFRDCEIIGGASGVFITLNQRGLPTGEAFIEMETQSDIDSALRHNKEKMGSRYIEVFESRLSVMEKVRSAQRNVRPVRETSRERGGRANFNRAVGGDRDRFNTDRGTFADRERGGSFGNRSRSGSDYAVRLRGMPWSATKRDIADFLHRVNISGGEEDGIVITLNEKGQPSGDAYVEVESQDDLDAAMRCHRRDMGSRYVEVFEAGMAEVEKARLETEGGGGRGGGGRGGAGGGRAGSRGNSKGHIVQLRGLPYKVSERDIADWLAEAADPEDVIIIMDRRGRPSGEADAIFPTRKEAMKVVTQMHRRDMGHRYVECFYEDKDGF